MIHYLSAFPRLMIPLNAISRSLKALFAFIIVLAVVIAAFALFFATIFSDLPPFRTFTQSYKHLLLAAFDADPDSMDDYFDHTQYINTSGYILLLFRCTVNLIFMNIFIAISEF